MRLTLILISRFSKVTGPSKQINVKHDLIDLLFLTMSAVISGALGCKDLEKFGFEKLDLLRKYIPFTHGIPVDTIGKLMGIIIPNEFHLAFIC